MTCVCVCQRLRAQTAIVTVVDKQDKQSGSDANTLYTVGCIARVVRLVEASKHSNDSNKKKSSTPAATHLMWVQGTQRLRVLEYTQTRPYRKALVKPLVDSATMGTKESVHLPCPPLPLPQTCNHRSAVLTRTPSHMGY